MTARVSPVLHALWAVDVLQAQHGHVSIIDGGVNPRLLAACCRAFREENQCGQLMRPLETIQH